MWILFSSLCRLAPTEIARAQKQYVYKQTNEGRVLRTEIVFFIQYNSIYFIYRVVYT